MFAEQAFLGVDVGGTKVAMGLVTPQGEVVAESMEPMREGTMLHSVAHTAQSVRTFVECLGAKPAACGISVAAALSATGTVLFAPNLPSWEGLPLEDTFTSELAISCFALYDGKAALLGESWLGAARNLRHVALLIIGTGVGGGLMVDGHLLEGRDRLAGVFGFLPIPSQGQVLDLESLISGPALAYRISNAVGRPLTSHDLLQRVRQGDPIASQVMADALTDLGLALSMVASLVNPEVILLGGGLGESYAAYSDVLEGTLRNRCQPVSGKKLRVRATALGNRAGWLGAAHAAMAATR